jgi:NAD(P)-dependent dehydrogenase (short-subunit alcohol dehydrogenase family)
MNRRQLVVVVTGASAGVGRATAKRFGRDGAKVALLARGMEGLQAAKREVEAAGGRALAIQTDVSSFAEVDAAATETEDQLGPIDVWVNDAMVTIFSEFKDIDPDEYRRATEVTYLGCVWGTKAALTRMLERDRGTIIQVSSALAYRGIPLQSPYCGAKHAIKGFTESVITELLHDGSNIRVSMVALPGLNTPQFTWGRTKLARQTTPVPPIYQPEVAADAVHYCAHHKRREIFVGAPTVYTIAGERISPWLLDRYLAKTGFSAQQTPVPLDPTKHDNLFSPEDAREDRGVHGPFDAQAHARSPQLWLAKNRRWVGLAGAAVAAAAARAFTSR